MQDERVFLVRILCRSRLSAVMGVERTPFGTVVVLIGQIHCNDRSARVDLLAGRYLEVVDLAEWKSYVAAVTVVV